MKRVDFVSVKCPDCGHWLCKTYITRYNADLHEVVRYHQYKFCRVKFTSVQELAKEESYPPKSAAELVA